MPPRRSSSSNGKRTGDARKATKNASVVQPTIPEVDASPAQQQAAATLQSEEAQTTTTILPGITETQHVSSNVDAALNAEATPVGTSSIRHVKKPRVGPPRGPYEGIETVRLAKAEGIKVIDFGYEQPDATPLLPIVFAFDAWKTLAFFDSQLFAHRAWNETGIQSGTMPLTSLLPVSNYYRLVECEWLDEQDFEWEDAKNVYHAGKKRLEEQQKAGKEPMCYMRKGSEIGVRPTFEQRYTNLLKYTNIIANIMALVRGESLPIENPEEVEEGAMYGPIPEITEHFKMVIRRHAYRAFERKRVEAIKRMLEEKDDEGMSGSQNSSNVSVAGSTSGDTEPASMDDVETDQANTGEDQPGHAAEDERTTEDRSSTAVSLAVEAPRPHESVSTSSHPRDLAMPARVMTRAQKRKLDAMSHPEVAPTPTLENRRRPLPRAACPLPLVARTSEIEEAPPAKRPRRAAAPRVTEPRITNSPRPVRKQTRGEAQTTTKGQPKAKTARKPAAGKPQPQKSVARKTQAKGRRGRKGDDVAVTSRSIRCK